MRRIGEYTTAKYLFFTRFIHSQNFASSYIHHNIEEIDHWENARTEPYQVLSSIIHKKCWFDL